MAFTLTLQPDAAAGYDTYMYQNGPTTNYGNGTTIGVGRSATGYRYRTLIKFTGLSIIPPSATILTAQLEFYITASAPASPITAEFYVVYRNWVELGATYTAYATDLSWTTNACDGAGTDRASVANFTGTIPASTGAFTISTGAGIVSDITTWITGTPNYGWLIKADTETSGVVASAIASSDHATASYRPKLTVTWEMGSPFPVSRWV